VRITYRYGGVCKELIVASAYIPYDSDEPPPTKEMRDIIDKCQSRKKQLIVGCDANAHHILWGSTGTSPRGESLMELLVSSNLNNLNCGNEPTFVVCNRKEVIDLTDESSLSDHTYICFQIGDITPNYVTFRNPKRTKWESYKDDLKANL
jgi:hypothetical protein